MDSVFVYLRVRACVEKKANGVVISFGLLVVVSFGSGCGTTFDHFVFPLVNIDKTWKEMNRRCRSRNLGKDLAPQTVLSPLLRRRFRFLEPNNEWIRLAGNVTKVNGRGTIPLVESPLDVILVGFGDEFISLDVFEFKGFLVKDATHPIGLFVHVIS